MEEIRELLHKKEAEFEQKYYEVAKHLATKYDKDMGVGYDMLKGNARGYIYNVPCLYEIDIDFDKDGMIADYKEIETLSKILNGDIQQ